MAVSVTNSHLGHRHVGQSRHSRFSLCLCLAAHVSGVRGAVNYGFQMTVACYSDLQEFSVTRSDSETSL